MQKAFIRNLFNLYRYKIAVVVLLFFSAPLASNAQKGSFNYDNKFSKKSYYFGITLGFNASKYRVEKDLQLINNDSVKTINSLYGPGFNLGIVANIKLGKRFDFRFLLPTLSFADRKLQYVMTDNSIVEKRIESVFLEFPVHFRYKSKPYKDFRVFVVGGIKYSIDLASNSRSRKAEDLLKLNQSDLAIELGVGFQVFFPYFILSPEIKFSYGVLDIHARDENITFSSTIDKLFSRGFAISLHFEG
ncbi:MULTISPECIES: porin family protein [unclassified Aureispira]|uniref:type IX secretion/gliding motility protein PorT/SprT n=1 Tax=unclassified Aureispira TaxID=2649989 RepID=UPI0009DD026F|nr:MULTISPECIES: porin family protein [unclassified Aureispira]WMX12982.1 porin family protein [Aureispira sp. CCB-E]